MKTQLLNNRYQILHTIGRGGFGETFLAVDNHMPSARKCVIKQLKPLIQEQEAEQWVKERFQREAAILEDLGEHESQIPRLFAYFSEGNNFYLVQEWIQGMNLQQIFQQQGIFPEEKVRTILKSLLPVLEYVHSKKIVHRDIKPENIILRNTDNLPVVIDFGAVKEAMATVIHTNGNSPFSIGIGTPGYMPSEQAAGRPIYSSDLYSLGLTALYLLTGKTPQDLETDSRTGEFIWQKSLNNINPNLASVIGKAIRFHPRDRFASAQEMLKALNFNSVVKTVAMTPQYPTRKTPQTVSKTRLYQEEPETNKPNFWIILLFILGIIGGSLLGVGVVVWQTQNQQAISPSKEIKPEKQNPPPEVFPEEETPITPENTTPPESENPLTPEVIFPPESENNNPSESETPTTPENNNPPESETPNVEQPPENNQTITNVPIIVTGTSKNQIINLLGNPTSISQGYWPNTEAILYKNYVQNQLDLGYIVDSASGQLRQTEVSFAANNDLGLMENTLNGLLQGNMSTTIKTGLAEVYNGEIDLRSFSAGNLKGMIQRQNGNHIYIAVWDSEFH